MKKKDKDGVVTTQRLLLVNQSFDSRNQEFLGFIVVSEVFNTFVNVEK